MVDLGGTWRFTSLTGADVGPHRPWLTFDGDGQVYGMAGVNRVRGTWTLDGGTLAFGPMASTLMAGPDEAMECERRVLGLLTEGVDVRAGDDGSVELVGADGTRATLVRGTEPALA